MEILSLGEKIKQKRKELNMTLKDLAKDRITPGQISLIESGRSNPSMDLLEYLANNLDTTVEYLMETEESQAEKIINYYQNMALSYIYNQEYALCEQYIQEAEKYIDKYNINGKKAKNSFLKAELYRIRNNYIKAEELYLDVQLNSTTDNNYKDVIFSLINLSKICIEQKAYYSAVNYLKQAEVAYYENSVGNEYLLGDIYYYLAKVCYINEKQDEAKEYAQLAKQKFNEINDVKIFSRKLMNRADEYMKKGDIALATTYSEKAINLLSEFEKNKYIYDIQNNLGILFLNFNEPQESEKYFRQAEKVKILNGDKDIIDTMINLCKNNIKLKKIKENYEILKNIENILDEKDTVRYVNVCIIKANMRMIEKNDDDAQKFFIQAYEHARKNNEIRLAAEVCIYISKYFSDRKIQDEAEHYLKTAVELYSSVGILSV